MRGKKAKRLRRDTTPNVTIQLDRPPPGMYLFGFEVPPADLPPATDACSAEGCTQVPSSTSFPREGRRGPAKEGATTVAVLGFCSAHAEIFRAYLDKGVQQFGEPLTALTEAAGDDEDLPGPEDTIQ